MVGNKLIYYGWEKKGGSEKGGEGGGRDSGLKAAWLAQLGEYQSAEQEVAGSNPNPVDQHSAFVMTPANS